MNQYIVAGPRRSMIWAFMGTLVILIILIGLLEVRTITLLIQLTIIVGGVIGCLAIFVWPYWGTLALVASLWLEGLLEFAGGLTPNRGIGVVTFIAVLAYKLRHREGFSWDRQDYLLVGYLIIAFLSLLIRGEPPNMQFYNALMGFMIYWLFVNSVRDDKAIKLTIWVIIAASGFVAGAAMWQLMNMRNLPYNPFFSYRFSGLKYNPNSVGELAFIGIPFIVYFFLKYKGFCIRFLLTITSIISMIGLLASGSRAAFLALIIALISLLLLDRDRHTFIIIALTVFLFIFVYGQVRYLAEPTVERITNIPFSLKPDYILETSAANQFWLNLKALKMFVDNPLLGVGFGNFLPASAHYPSYFIEEGRSHNILLNTAAEMGLFGILLLFMIAFRVIKQLRLSAATRSIANKNKSATKMLLVMRTLWLGWVPILILHRAYIDRVLFVLLAITTVIARLSQSNGRTKRLSS